jgi:hypothetical protein
MLRVTLEEQGEMREVLLRKKKARRFPRSLFGEITKQSLTSVNRGRYSALARRNYLWAFLLVIVRRAKQKKAAVSRKPGRGAKGGSLSRHSYE